MRGDRFLRATLLARTEPLARVVFLSPLTQKGGKMDLKKLNWNETRKAKATVCRVCQHFDNLNLGCRFYLIPSKDCPRFKEVKNVRR